MLRMQIVIQENRVVIAGTQKTLRFSHIVCDVDAVSLEAIRKPAMAASVIIQQKDSNGMTIGPDAGKSELSE
jgi:hypothetical protein